MYLSWSSTLLMYLSFSPTGLHHDSVPPSLLEGRASVLPEHQQPEYDIWQPSGEEDLGSRYVLRPFQALLHPRHHHRQRDAEGLPWWERPVQPQVRTKREGDEAVSIEYNKGAAVFLWFFACCVQAAGSSMKRNPSGEFFQCPTMKSLYIRDKNTKILQRRSHIRKYERWKLIYLAACHTLKWELTDLCHSMITISRQMWTARVLQQCCARLQHSFVKELKLQPWLKQEKRRVGRGKKKAGGFSP